MKIDAVIIGGGHSGCATARALVKAGFRVCVVSEGLSLSAACSAPASREAQTVSPYSALSELAALGAVVLKGDSAVSGIWDGDTLKAVVTRNLSDTPLEADYFVLATGKFFSRGLLSDMERIWEPVFGADVAYTPGRSSWYDPDFSAPQPFMGFGVMTDGQGRVLFGGKPAANLYAAGSILSAGSKALDIDKLTAGHAGK